MPSVVYFLTFL